MKRKSTPQEIAERIVRNMPIRDVEYLHVDTDYGRLYFALGLDANNAYHGLWAFDRGPGMARPIEFAKNQPRGLVIKTIIADGLDVLKSMDAKGLLNEGRFSVGR